MADPAPEAVREPVPHGSAPPGARPPRWTFPLFRTRVRMSLGLGVWLSAATAVLVWRPAPPLAWVPLAAVLGVAASTLAHEGAHAWAAHRLGYRVEWVVLGGLLGVTAYVGRADRPLERAAVALAGPAASAALVLALLALRVTLARGAASAAVVEVGIGINAVALGANLLPVGGTDGAHLVRSLLEHVRTARPPDGR
jgi:Zn-dependent protease